MTLTLAAAALAGLALELPSAPVAGGSALCISAQVEPAADVVAAEARWQDRTFSLDPDPGGVIAVVLPVPVDVDGGQTLELAVRTADGRELARTATIEIAPSSPPLGRVVPVDGSGARTSPERTKLTELLSADHSPRRLWSDSFRAPVWGPIATGFGRSEGGPHDGVDYSLRRGTSVRAPADGVVSAVADLPVLGNTIIIDHGQGLRSLVAHLAVPLAAPGDAVTAGRIIGRAGATGTAEGTTLHYGLYVHGVAVDPASLEEPPEFLRTRPDPAAYARVDALRRRAAATPTPTTTPSEPPSVAAYTSDRAASRRPLRTPQTEATTVGEEPAAPSIASDGEGLVAALQARLSKHFPGAQIDVVLSPKQVDEDGQDVEITFIELGDVDFVHAAQTTISLAGRIATSALDESRLTLNDPLRGATIPVLIRDARRLGAPMAPSMAIDR